VEEEREAVDISDAGHEALAVRANASWRGRVSLRVLSAMVTCQS
jgi:hypothetical protein